MFIFFDLLLNYFPLFKFSLCLVIDFFHSDSSVNLKGLIEIPKLELEILHISTYINVKMSVCLYTFFLAILKPAVIPFGTKFLFAPRKVRIVCLWFLSILASLFNLDCWNFGTTFFMWIFQNGFPEFEEKIWQSYVLFLFLFGFFCKFESNYGKSKKDRNLILFSHKLTG